MFISLATPVASGSITPGNIGTYCWALNGNTVGAEKWLGTADNFDLPFRSNGTEWMRLLTTGEFGIGTILPTASLHVDGTLRYVDGNESAGYVLTADLNGNATWQAPSGGGSSVTAQEGITAFAGGGQGSATACTKLYNYIDTVATTGDSVKALAAVNSGTSATFQFFQNNGANELNLYPQSGENFYGLAADVAIPLPAGSTVTIVCATTGSFRYSIV